MLDGNMLGTEIVNAVKTGDKKNSEQIWLKIAEIIVKHIQANAVVVPTTLMAPSSGGPVSGAGTIK
jgi:hypothetical protein